MTLHPQAEITLAYSTTHGLIAIGHGTQYGRAHSVLKQAGFTRHTSGIHTAPAGDVRTAATLLQRLAGDHGVRVSVSRRPYLADIAGRIAARLPGSWAAEIHVHSHPLWQGDHIGQLWNHGPFVQALHDEQVPYAANLTNGTDLTLLIAEDTSGPEGGLWVAPYIPQEFGVVYHPPYTLPSLTLPAQPEHAARAIADQLLPAYRQAAYAWRLDTVTAALDTLDSRLSPQAPKGDSRPAERELVTQGQDAAEIWTAFHGLLAHGPGVIDECAAAAEQAADAAVVARLKTALASGQAALDDWGRREKTLTAALRWIPTDARARLAHQALPDIATWLADRDVFLRIAARAAPQPPPANSPRFQPRSLPNPPP
uniref:hypothetical protein n=1 Tax=Streptomyces acidiscabies TaxID=42234 RepID=UPI0009524047